MSKYGHRPLNWFEAIVNKLGGEEAADCFLRGELSVSEPARLLREEDGVIYFSVTSDGTTGEEWIERLKDKGSSVGYYASQMLRSPDFKPTSGVTTKVAVLKVRLFEDNNRSAEKIRAESYSRKLSKPNAELACLIRLKFTDKEIEAMGLTDIVVMHEPIKTHNGLQSLLCVGGSNYEHRLSTYYVAPDVRLSRGSGFAFAVSQVSSQP